MTKSRTLAAVVGAALVLASVTASAAFAALKLDETHSKVAFTASTLLFDVEGNFKKFEVLLDGSLNEPDKAQVKVVIDAASIFTDNAKRDDHLRSADFFDVKKYPHITFTSSKVSQTAKGVEVTGSLEMRGKKKVLSVPFKVARGKNGAGNDTIAYKGKLNLDRTDFGVGADSVAAKISLEDEVEITLFILVFP